MKERNERNPTTKQLTIYHFMSNRTLQHEIKKLETWYEKTKRNEYNTMIKFLNQIIEERKNQNQQ